MIRAGELVKIDPGAPCWFVPNGWPNARLPATCDGRLFVGFGIAMAETSDDWVTLLIPNGDAGFAIVIVRPRFVGPGALL